MNKKIALVVGVLVLAVAGYFVLRPKCKQPSELMVQMTQLGCAMNLINEDLRVEACRELGREDNCDFVEEDREAIQSLINRKVNACAKEKLEEQNYCSDTVKDLDK